MIAMPRRVNRRQNARNRSRQAVDRQVARSVPPDRQFKIRLKDGYLIPRLGLMTWHSLSRARIEAMALYREQQDVNQFYPMAGKVVVEVVNGDGNVVFRYPVDIFSFDWRKEGF